MTWQEAMRTWSWWVGLALLIAAAVTWSDWGPGVVAWLERVLA